MGRIKYCPGNLLPAALLLLVCSSWCAADAVEVTDVDSSDVKKLELKEGQLADVMVYLKSFGDMVDQYLVTLRRESDNSRVAALLSDRHGRVRFEKVPPERYRVEVSRRIREDGELSTVTIGDVIITVAKGVRFGGAKGDAGRFGSGK